MCAIMQNDGCISLHTPLHAPTLTMAIIIPPHYQDKISTAAAGSHSLLLHHLLSTLTLLKIKIPEKRRCRPRAKSPSLLL